MSEPERSIKVFDRRLFNSEGELREDVEAELAAPDPPQTEAQKAPAPAVEEPKITTDPSFMRLLEMLAQTASLYLEGYPDAAGRRQVDLAGARQIIDSLLVLREKTRGRLSFEEGDALDGLLGELQVAFTRLAAPPKPRGPAGAPARRG